MTTVREEEAMRTEDLSELQVTEDRSEACAINPDTSPLA